MPTRRIPLVLLLALTVAACGDDSPTDNGNGGGNNNTNDATFKNEVTATVNGNAWAATNTIATRTDAGGLVVLTFVAYGPDNSNITFGLASASVRKHTIDGGPVQAAIEYGGKTYGTGETGTITVDVLTAKGMKGSFSIDANTTKGEKGTATGSFDVEF